ncbi:ABC transporter permease [Enterococcus florum]|uniref:ABC transporter permease n=1 Tax=Enterococcus florum TaxID=2480627 RepID=A0A4P5PBI1_9ENTE|nr:FtsX-like permease family protein [Enterococcus florum]GCF95545.1 ABC transporter permease [Enterococcus florum]
MFYMKLAFTNLKKNHRAYLPFLISMLFLVAAITMTQVIVKNPGMKQLPDSYSAITMFSFGNIILMIFSGIFSIYTNSFLLKQRKKEFGLYNVLGLGKRELYIMMFWENFFSFWIVLAAGIISGTILGKLGFLVLQKMIGIGERFVFSLTFETLGIVVLLFLGIFLFLFLLNCLQIKRTKPIELLYGDKRGEIEPKSKWIATVIGIGCLAGGYSLALLIESPVDALTFFFVAVVLVIFGTYNLFISGSITLLKTLKNRKRFYYKTNHFISVSSMIYRMKQNAAGLASICILSTMVLVTMGTTGSLFFGQQELLNSRYSHSVSISSYQNVPEIRQSAEQLAQKKGIELTNMQEVETTKSLFFKRTGDTFQFRSEAQISELNDAAMISLMTMAEYNKHAERSVELKDNQIAVFTASGDISQEAITINGTKYRVKEKVDHFIGLHQQNNLSDVFIIAVKDQQMIDQLLKEWRVPEEDRQPQYSLGFDINADESERYHFAQDLKTMYSSQFSDEALGFSFDSKDIYARSNKTFTSGFFFLGMIFGVIFTLATALIIYYKQISEGIDDQQRFEILQKVGMSHEEVRKVIHSQVLLVFLFPLLVAVVHLGFAFPLINKLLILFGLVNWHVILITTIAVVLIFSLLYFIVYQLTARSYYKIVEREA